MRVPFVVYANFECFIEKLDTRQPNNGETSYTKQYQKHTPSGVTYYIKCFDDKVYIQGPVKYTKQSEDDDIAQTFIEKLVQDITWICRNCGKEKMTITPKLLLLSAAPLRVTTEDIYRHRRFGSVFMLDALPDITYR